MKILLSLALLAFASCTTLEQFRGPAAVKAVICPSESRRTIPQDFVPKDRTKIKVAFFDADSTLRVSKVPGSFSATSPDDVMILPHMAQALRKIEEENYLIYIVSNQGGVSAGESNCETAEKALQYAIELVKKDGGIIHGYDFAENYDDSRKPEIGMAIKLELVLKHVFGNEASIDKTNSLMVGDSAFKKGVDFKKPGPDGDWVVATANDEGAVPGTHFSNSDRLFAKNYGIKFVEAAVFFGWRKEGVDVFEQATHVEEYLKNHP